MLPTSVVVIPSTVLNARDCGALVTIAAAFSITLSLLIYAARLFTRWPWRTLLGYDDLVTSVATVCVSTLRREEAPRSLAISVNDDLTTLYIGIVRGAKRRCHQSSVCRSGRLA
jgi:hypothetical protein